MLNGLISEGLENFGFFKKSQSLKLASFLAMEHFGNPIELYIKKDNQLVEYCSSSGQTTCHIQAWSAASALD